MSMLQNHVLVGLLLGYKKIRVLTTQGSFYTRRRKRGTLAQSSAGSHDVARSGQLADGQATELLNFELFSCTPPTHITLR
jgi:hypothetical protein